MKALSFKFGENDKGQNAIPVAEPFEGFGVGQDYACVHNVQHIAPYSFVSVFTISIDMSLDSLPTLWYTSDMGTRREIADANRIIKIVNGSRLYGTFTTDSDYDYIGVFVEPPEYVFSDRKIETAPLHNRGSQEKTAPGDQDGQQYSLRHFLKLALDGNPSILTAFFAGPEFWEESDAAGELLMSFAPDVVSMQAAPRFKGYLKNQLDRLTGVRTGHIPNRPELVEKYGYDTKYAMSVARLALQGIEFFETGRIESPMCASDIKYLQNMRHGLFSYDQCVDDIQKLEMRLYAAIAEDNLPDEPNYERIYCASQEIHQLKWKLN